MPRLFVAVWPPPVVLDLVAALPRPAVPGIRWTGRQQWHVTLRFLGPVAELDEVASALAGLEAQAAVAQLGPAVDRFGQRVLQVPVGGLDAIAAGVAGVTADLGQPADDRPFRGHMTLARARNGNVDLRPLTGHRLDARWTVTEVCLVESRLSPAGARYEVLGRYPLGNR
jgi:2'-5' RNA ligase